jgi:hypothetical protein
VLSAIAVHKPAAIGAIFESRFGIVPSSRKNTDDYQTDDFSAGKHCCRNGAIIVGGQPPVWPFQA